MSCGHKSKCGRFEHSYITSLEVVNHNRDSLHLTKLENCKDKTKCGRSHEFVGEKSCGLCPKQDFLYFFSNSKFYSSYHPYRSILILNVNEKWHLEIIKAA